MQPFFCPHLPFTPCHPCLHLRPRPRPTRYDLAFLAPFSLDKLPRAQLWLPGQCCEWRPDPFKPVVPPSLGRAAEQACLGEPSNPNPGPNPDPDPNLTLTLTLTLTPTPTLTPTKSRPAWAVWGA